MSKVPLWDPAGWPRATQTSPGRKNLGPWGFRVPPSNLLDATGHSLRRLLISFLNLMLLLTKALSATWNPKS